MGQRRRSGTKHKAARTALLASQHPAPRASQACLSLRKAITAHSPGSGLWQSPAAKGKHAAHAQRQCSDSHHPQPGETSHVSALSHVDTARELCRLMSLASARVRIPYMAALCKLRLQPAASLRPSGKVPSGIYGSGLAAKGKHAARARRPCSDSHHPQPATQRDCDSRKGRSAITERDALLLIQPHPCTLCIKRKTGSSIDESH